MTGHAPLPAFPRKAGMNATLFLISASYVSARRAGTLIARLEATAPGPAMAIRLDGDGTGLWAALDTLAARGARAITLRPLGLPFSQSLERWLPGAAGAWLARRGAGAPALHMATSPEHCDTALAAVTRARVTTRPIAATPRGHVGKGWDDVPPMRHHLLVCAGPRCHLHDAPSLAATLKAEIARAGLTRACLITLTGCLYPCNRGPVLVHYPAGDWYRLPDTDAVRHFVHSALTMGQRPPDLHFHTTGETHEPA